MAITALPTPPSRQDPANFADRADEFLGALPLFATEANTLATDVNTLAGNAATSASSAATSASSASDSVDDATAQVVIATEQAVLAAASASSALNAPGTNATSTTSMIPGTGSQAFTLAQLGKTFVIGQWVTISDTVAPATNFSVGPITAFNSGTGAITVDRTFGIGAIGTSWSVVAASTPGIASALPVTTVTGTTQTAVAGNHYLMTNVAASTLTLNVTPTNNDEVWVTFTNGLYTNNIARNGSTIYSDASDFLINAGVLLTWKFKYLNGTWRTT